VKKSPIQTSKSFRTNQNESFVGLQAFNNALREQKSGSVMEMINGTRMLVFYEPVQFHSTTWAVLLLSLYNLVNDYTCVSWINLNPIEFHSWCSRIILYTKYPPSSEPNAAFFSSPSLSDITTT
jgi:hypothetical protein